MSYELYIDALYDVDVPEEDYEMIDHQDLVAEGAIKPTEEEYGGYMIDLEKLPKDIKYLHVYRC